LFTINSLFVEAMSLVFLVAGIGVALENGCGAKPGTPEIKGHRFVKLNYFAVYPRHTNLVF
jgi:hypothetical protein